MTFGRPYIRGEGCPIHPMDMAWVSDEHYKRQLNAYYDCYPDEKEFAFIDDLELLEGECDTSGKRKKAQGNTPKAD
jgi:hypothetical protein